MSKWTVKHLRLINRRLGFNPKVIIDIGVGHGTPVLYEAFPDKYFVLIEALSVYEKSINKIFEKYKGQLVNKAAGSKSGKLEIRHDVLKPQMSSFYDKTEMASKSDNISIEKVDVEPLDKIMQEVNIPGRYGLKIDAEGHELEVIKGATETLKKCDFVIAEASVAKRYEGSYNFAELIAEMAKNDFHMLDVLSEATTPPKFIDVIFTKKQWHK